MQPSSIHQSLARRVAKKEGWGEEEAGKEKREKEYGTDRRREGIGRENQEMLSHKP